MIAEKSGLGRALQSADDRRGVWLPDDFEERWETLAPPERWEVIAYWRKRNAEGTLGWQQRRRIRKVVFDGGPLTETTGAEGNLRSIAEKEQTEAGVRRRVKAYGVEGERKIQELANKLLRTRGTIPEERALDWAEKTYRRELRGFG